MGPAIVVMQGKTSARCSNAAAKNHPEARTKPPGQTKNRASHKNRIVDLEDLLPHVRKVKRVKDVRGA